MLNKKFYTQKGVTLFELIMYVAIFSLCTFFVFSTTMYMQKVFERASVEYAGKIFVYKYLEMLQQYLTMTDRVELEENDIILYLNRPVRVRHRLVDGEIVLENFYTNTAVQKTIPLHSDLHITKFELSLPFESNNLATRSSRSTMYVYIEWQYHNKSFSAHERLIIPNRL